jgi:putative FmdB family regulatory protein
VYGNVQRDVPQAALTELLPGTESGVHLGGDFRQGEMMPLFDFKCRGCGHTFEALVRGQNKPACPKCKSEDLEKLLSLPAVKSESTKAKAMAAAKKRDAAQGKDRMHEQLRYEESHDRHG